MNLSCLILSIWCSLSGPAIAVDGDTLDIRGTRVRLWGIDAPEWNEPLGQESKTVLAHYLLNHHVTCDEAGPRSHNRIVARCYIGGVDIGEHMVRSGLALDCRKFSGGRYRDLETPTARHRITQKPYC